MSRTIVFTALLAAAAATVAPATLTAQRGVDLRPAAAPRAESEARLAAALDSATRDSLRAVVLDARRRGLPAEPLYAKALEGVEKGAPGVRIQGALRALLVRLQTAHDALAPVASDAELVAGADAIAAGVPRSALHDLRKISGRRSTTTALGVLAQLVSRGVPVAKATDAVKQLLARGGGQQQLLALERNVNGDIAVGMSPDVALDVRVQAMMIGLPMAAPTVGTSSADAQALSSANAGGPVRRP